MIIIISYILFTKDHHCICITMKVLVVVAMWLGDILLQDQQRRVGFSIVVAVLETTQTCDLVHNDSDEDDYMYVTLL